MNDLQSNSVYFENLYLRDYGIFFGPNELKFDRHRTLIVGAAGTGKTTIVNALAQLGPITGIKAHVLAEPPEMSVEVVTKGNRMLVKKYSSVIFLGCKSADRLMRDRETIFADILDHQTQEAVKDEARAIFQTLVIRKYGEIKAYKDLSFRVMSAGERVCFYYAFAFAIRKMLNLDLPVVFDSPYGMLAPELRNGVSAFLNEQSCQQILLGTESEFGKNDIPHYKLDYDHTESCSRIKKTTKLH